MPTHSIVGSISENQGRFFGRKGDQLSISVQNSDKFGSFTSGDGSSVLSAWRIAIEQERERERGEGEGEEVKGREPTGRGSSWKSARP